MNQIINIKEVYNYTIEDKALLEKLRWKEYYHEWEGYEITTKHNVFLLLIGKGQICCEQYGSGYFSTTDRIKDFIGADLKNVSIVNTALKVKKWTELDISENDAMFVNFETSKGLFQIAVYNSHNGYYGHSIVFFNNKDVVVESSL